MTSTPTSPVQLDELVRSTTNYASWFEGASATARRIGVHGFSFDAHDQPSAVTLDSFHLLVCVRGHASIRRAMNDAIETMELGPGDVLVNPMGTPLRWIWAGAVEVLNVTVHPAYFDDVVRGSVGSAASMRPRAVPYAPDDSLSQLGLELHRELTGPELLGAQRGANAVAELIALHLLRKHVEVRIESGGRDRTFDVEERRVLLAYVDARLDRPISVEQLAALVHLSEHHFSRTFRATFGVAPHAWVRARRLERAHELLVTTDESISSIAMATGFSDQSHLTRCFRAHFEATPAALRRARRSSTRSGRAPGDDPGPSWNGSLN